MYGAAALAGGFLLGEAFGWDPFGLHLAGTLFGTHADVERAEVITWAIYNVAVYAVVPLVWFRGRYTAEAPDLRSNDRRGDAVLIMTVLVVESLFQIASDDLHLRHPPTPVHATHGLTATTVILGGIACTALHARDAWTTLDTPRDAVLSVMFLTFTYFGPGMIKTFLTVRTGNAWVHVWAYHALASHTLKDTPAHRRRVRDPMTTKVETTGTEHGKSPAA